MSQTNHNFQIDLKGIIDVLSNHLYSGPQVFLRELLQNGVDAISARAKLEGEHPTELSMQLYELEGQPKMLFRDSGVGLTEDEVHRFLATIGQSSKRGGSTQDFIGQFGIGLLSCFVVSDAIVLRTRSAKAPDKVLQWVGYPEGSYTISEIDHDMPIGSEVELSAKPDMHEYFTANKVSDVLSYYGGLLPYPINVTTEEGTTCINQGGAPWNLEYDSDEDRQQAYLNYGEAYLGVKPLTAIALRTNHGSIKGLAFVVPWKPALNTPNTHRVYLKGMLLTEEASNLLPDWAFFVKCVINTQTLQPTAAREGFYENQELNQAREELGQQLRQYLVHLAKHDPNSIQQLIRLHGMSIRALALQDESFFRLFIPWLPFETSLGTLTLPQYLEQSPANIWYMTNVDQFRQISQIANAQSQVIINGAYVYEAELLERYGQINDKVLVERINADALAQDFNELNAIEAQHSKQFSELAKATLEPYGCAPHLCYFKPIDMLTLFVSSQEATFYKNVQNTKAVTGEGLWGDVLDNITPEKTTDHSTQVYFNYGNDLIRRVVGLDNQATQTQMIEILYVQSLMLGHHPLSSQELKLLNNGLANLINLSLQGINSSLN